MHESAPSVDVCDMAEQYWPIKVSKYGTYLKIWYTSKMIKDTQKSHIR